MKLKSLIIAGAIGILALLNPLKVDAAEKNMTVPFEKDYSKATFQMNFKETGEYVIKITRPDGSSESKNVSSDHTEVTLENIKKGSYEIQITSSDDNPIEVSAKVDCTPYTSNTGQENKVTVSHELTNLQMCFIDGNLRATWSDTSAGKVNIKVTNPSTMQVLANTTVSGTSYTLGIPKDINTIEVYIVPASSAKIAGAGTNYTLDVVRDFPVSVKWEDKTLTNKERTTVLIELDKAYQIYVLSNKMCIIDEVMEQGIKEKEIPLSLSRNECEVQIVDEAGNVNTFKHEVTKDVTAPTIKLNKDLNNLETTNSTIEIAGTLKDSNVLYINDIEVQAGNYGQFSFTYKLEMGENNINIYAVDEAGNVGQLQFKVFAVEKKANVTVLVIIGVAFIAGIGILVYSMLKGKKGGKSGDDNTTPPKKEKEPKEDKKKANNTVPAATPVAKAEKKAKKVKKVIPEALKKFRRKSFWGTVIVSATEIAVMFIFVTRVICVTTITSGSMEPTLMTGDAVIYNRLSYVAKDVQRGDMICFYSDEFGKLFGKRVIGIPGDTISFADGFVIINGAVADESAYLDGDIETNCTKTFVIPENTVFVMGDNREFSYDSRNFKNPFIPQDKIIGKYLGTIPIPF